MNLPPIHSTRCETCKHWEKDNINMWRGFGFCNRATSTDGEPNDKETLFFALDSETYRAKLMTSPLFVCCGWE